MNTQKYQINIITTPEFDRTIEAFQDIVSFVDNLANEVLDADTTILVVRIPDYYTLNEIEDSMPYLMDDLRLRISTSGVNAYVIALQFDVECTNVPDKVVCWSELMETMHISPDFNFDDEVLVKEYIERVDKVIEAMITRLNTPKIHIPNIIV